MFNELSAQTCATAAFFSHRIFFLFFFKGGLLVTLGLLQGIIEVPFCDYCWFPLLKTVFLVESGSLPGLT